MAIGASSLSILCLAIENFIREGLNATENNIDVTLGAPAVAVNATPKMNRINLFFNRFEPSGYAGNGDPGEPWLLRLFCMITAFGEDDNAENISAGEFELRIIGEVIRLFHETPVLSTLNVNGEQVRLQTIFQTLNNESINQLWSTQNDASYRPSVAYEFSLGPIAPLKKKIPPKKVALVGLNTGATMDKAWDAEQTGILIFPFKMKTVDISNRHWKPAISFVVDGHCTEAMQIDLAAVDLDNDTLDIWLAGDKNTNVSFVWLIWDSNAGWLEQDALLTARPLSESINPDAVPENLLSLGMPFDSGLTDNSAQAQLVALRNYIDPLDGISRTLRSNPLLITFYRS